MHAENISFYNNNNVYKIKQTIFFLTEHTLDTKHFKSMPKNMQYGEMKKKKKKTLCR